MSAIKSSLAPFEEESVLKNCLDETKIQYRPYDPGFYLYNLLLKNDYKNKFDKEFIELVYVTLSAWNMNSRGAKLNDIEEFESSIIENRAIFDKIYDKTILDLRSKEIEDCLYKLFNDLKLVASNKPPLVTFSKTMHFFLPDLIVPIDRKYTLNYFYKRGDIPKEKEKQFKIFFEVEAIYSDFVNGHNLEKYIDNVWNRNVPKVLDNMVIGYIRRQG